MISIKNLNKRFGSKQVLHDINLELEPGEIFGFLGPNGAGKTTTLKIITGILKPDQGSVSINGIDIESDPINAKKQFSFIGDSPDICLNLKGKEFLKFIADIYEIPKDSRNKLIEELSKEFGLYDVLNDRIKTYSHGMRQKMMVIGSMLSNPKIWILDEPMTGLDPKSSFQLKNKMREHADGGGTVLFSTHVLEVAEKVCDRIGVINKGQLLFVGKIDELRASMNQDSSLEELFLEITQ